MRGNARAEEAGQDRVSPLHSIIILVSICLFSGLAGPSVGAQSRGRKGSAAESQRERIAPPANIRHNSSREEEPRSARKGKKGLPSTTLDSARARAATPRSAEQSSSPAARRRDSRTGADEALPGEARSEDRGAPPVSPTSSNSNAYAEARIEVIEHGSPEFNRISQQLSYPQSGPGSGRTGAGRSGSGRVNISNRRIEVEIDPARVVEIQRALIDLGLLEGEPTGVYDEATYAAMREFQLREKIDVTGYPTAHALKRLGLSK